MRALRVPLEGDQRIDQALHSPEPRPNTRLNNYLHRPRRTRREQIVRVPSAPDAYSSKDEREEKSVAQRSGCVGV